MIPFYTHFWSLLHVAHTCNYSKMSMFFNLGPPASPLSPVLIPLSITSAVMSWVPSSDSSCVTSYTITLTNITEGNISYNYNTTTNATNMTLTDLTQGAEYISTVAGVDVEGRVGNESIPSEAITLDSECEDKISTYVMNTFAFTLHCISTRSSDHVRV